MEIGQARVRYQQSDDEVEDEQDVAEHGNESSMSAQTDPRQLKPQFFIYKPIPKTVFYPVNWSGPQQKVDRFTDVYGLIIYIRDGICYFLTRNGLLTYKPQFLMPYHELIGSWALLEVDLNREICAKPKSVNPPVQTRIINDESAPYLLIYDYVRVEDDHTLWSKFLGSIQNSLDLCYNNKRWLCCNVEYTITASYRGPRLCYQLNAVKFHGAVEVHSGLPDILSYQPSLSSMPSKEQFIEAFYSLQEMEELRKLRIEMVRRKNSQDLHRDLPYLEKLTIEEENKQVENAPETVEQKLERSGQDSEPYESEVPLSDAAQDNHEPDTVEADTSADNDMKPQCSRVLSENSSGTEFSSSNSGQTLTVFRETFFNRSKTVQPTYMMSSTPINGPKNILIIHATFGYPLELIEHYLKKNYNVVVHFIDLGFTNIIEQIITLYRNRFWAKQGTLDEQEVNNLMKMAINKLGSIDVVYYFTSHLCKSDELHGSLENLHYLFEQNIKPLVYISKNLIQRSKRTSLIAVAPLFDLSSLQPQLMLDIKYFLSYMRLVVDEIMMNTKNTSWPIVTHFVDFDDYERYRLDFGTSHFDEQVCLMLLKLEENSDFACP